MGLGLGLAGAVLSPFVVGGNAEAVDWLYGYFGLVAAVGLAVDAARRWAWVSALSLVLGLSWKVLVPQAVLLAVGCWFVLSRPDGPSGK